MLLPAGRLTGKVCSTVCILYLLFFTLGIAPKHLATFSSHDTCEICALIHNPPDLQTGEDAPVRLCLNAGSIAQAAALPAIEDPIFGTDPSRAPPSHS